MIRLCSKSTFQVNTLLKLARDRGKNELLYYSSNRLCSKIHQTEGNHQTGQLIYDGPLTAKVKIVKFFSLSSSVLGIIAQPIIYKEMASLDSTSLLIATSAIIGFFTFVTPVLFHMLTKKYVTQIFYDSQKEEYTAITMSFFLRQKQHKFKVQDVIVPDLPGMFSTVTVNGKGLFIEAEHFSAPIHYAKIMGYDKPMDFKLGNIDDSSGSK